MPLTTLRENVLTRHDVPGTMELSDWTQPYQGWHHKNEILLKGGNNNPLCEVRDFYIMRCNTMWSSLMMSVVSQKKIVFTGSLLSADWSNCNTTQISLLSCLNHIKAAIRNFYLLFTNSLQEIFFLCSSQRQWRIINWYSAFWFFQQKHIIMSSHSQILLKTWWKILIWFSGAIDL